MQGREYHSQGEFGEQCPGPAHGEENDRPGSEVRRRLRIAGCRPISGRVSRNEPIPQGLDSEGPRLDAKGFGHERLAGRGAQQVRRALHVEAAVDEAIAEASEA